jgi:ribose-phosphate pyrophosphokinase
MNDKRKAMLFSLSANKELTEEISKYLDLPVSKVNVTKFANGEILCEPVDTVREKNVFIVQSTCAPVNDNLFEILIFVDALKRASAHQINVIIPFFGYARQDRKSKPRQPITSRLVADLLKAAGVHRVITVDLHAAQIQGFFSCLVDEITAIPMIAEYFAKKDVSNTVIVSPDHGGVNRARRVAERLNLPLAIIDKRRTGPNVAEVMNIVGDVAGKNCLMIDDMIDTAGSAHAGAKALKANGAKSISIACTHGVFSYPAEERLLDGTFDEIVTTNSIPLKGKMKDSKIVTVLSLAHLIAKVIKSIEEGAPVSQVYNNN